jgi:hypothetical protein
MAYNPILPDQIIVDGDMSADVVSLAISTMNQDNIGFHLAWTGSAVGVFSIEVSANHKQDRSGNISSAGTWVTIPLSSPITAANTPDDAYIDLNQLSAPWIRVKYARTSGTGSLGVYIVGKGV